MTVVITERELVAACREALNQWPQARAAVLFGSRARGTQGLDSDWDVAIVLKGDEPRHPDLATSVFPRQGFPHALARVDAWALSEDDLERRACVLGTLPYAICRDGTVLAGEWRRPDPRQMGTEATVDPEDWTYRMRLAVAKVDAAITPIENVANSATWMDSAAHCSSLVQATADAAELLVKAVIERRGLPADRSHDVAELAAEFGAQRPDETELAERIAALNGTSRRHHVEMYRFRPPDVSDVKAAVRRLLGTLDLWASEIETGDDDMAGQQAELARMAAHQGTAWSDRICAQVRTKSDEGGPAQAAGEAALADRSALVDAIALFRDRMRRVVDGPAPRDRERSTSIPDP